MDVEMVEKESDGSTTANVLPIRAKPTDTGHVATDSFLALVTPVSFLFEGCFHMETWLYEHGFLKEQ